MARKPPHRGTPAASTSTRNLTAREADYYVRIRKIDKTAETVRALIKYGSYALSAYFFSVAARAFAGEDTLVNFAMNIAGRLSVNQWAGWVLAGICGTGWMRQRKLHHDYIERTAPLHTARELSIDPNRSSSGLTPRGHTNPGDAV